MPLRIPKEHQTTIRFSDELWEAIVVAASALDISAAQYVRDRPGPSSSATAASKAPAKASEVPRKADLAQQASLGHAESTLAPWERARLLREEASGPRLVPTRRGSA